MKVLGITGGIGSGKSEVLSYLESSWGAYVLQLDRVAAQLQERGGPCYGQMIDLFGEQVLLPDGNLDRAKIAKMVFSDRALLDKLNAIVHPAVWDECRRLLQEQEPAGNRPFAALEAALLLEGGYDSICDEIWYIYSREDVRRERLAASRGYTKEKTDSIIACQHDEAWYRERTTLMIDNSGAWAQTAAQIDRGLREHGFLLDSQRKQR